MTDAEFNDLIHRGIVVVNRLVYCPDVTVQHFKTVVSRLDRQVQFLNRLVQSGNDSAADKFAQESLVVHVQELEALLRRHAS